MYCFGLISFLPDFFFPSLRGFKKGGKEGKGKRKQYPQAIVMKTSLAGERCIFYSELNNVARGQLVIPR